MERKRFVKKNLIVIGALVLVIVALAVAAPFMRAKPRVNPDEVAVEDGVKAYLGVYVYDGEQVKMERVVPLKEAGQFTIEQGDMVNVVEVTADSVRMYSSTCDNQDCVLQGTVTLDNRNERVLQNMILCLPHQVVLELYSAQEVTINE